MAAVCEQRKRINVRHEIWDLKNIYIDEFFSQKFQHNQTIKVVYLYKKGRKKDVNA